MMPDSEKVHPRVDKPAEEERPSNISVLRGNEANKVSDDEARALAEALVSAMDKGSKYTQKYDVNLKIDSVTGNIKKRAKDPNTIFLRDGDRIVGVASIDNLNREFKGRPALEMTVLVILPEYREKGLSRDLFKERFNIIEDEYPNAVIFVATRNQMVKDKYLERGFVETDYAKYSDFKREGLPKRKIDERTEDGWSAYVSDPGFNEYTTSSARKLVDMTSTHIRRRVRNIGGLIRRIIPGQRS